MRLRARRSRTAGGSGTRSNTFDAAGRSRSREAPSGDGARPDSHGAGSAREHSRAERTRCDRITALAAVPRGLDRGWARSAAMCALVPAEPGVALRGGPDAVLVGVVENRDEAHGREHDGAHGADGRPPTAFAPRHRP